jgi:hypothetical protein
VALRIRRARDDDRQGIWTVHVRAIREVCSRWYSAGGEGRILLAAGENPMRLTESLLRVRLVALLLGAILISEVAAAQAA